MRAALLVAVAALYACKYEGAFKCETSDQCRLGDTLAYCEPSGACALDDATCASHRRYDETAGDSAGSCVEDVVAGHVRDRYIVNDEMGNPTVIEQDDPTLSVKVLLEDGTTPDVRMDHGGAFEFDLPAGQRYEVTTMGAAGTTVEQHDARYLLWTPTFAGRPDRVPVTKPTPLQFRYTGAPMGAAYISSTGVFTQTSSTVNALMFSLDWKTAQSLNGDVGLLEANKHDHLYYNAVADGGGYETNVAGLRQDVTLVDGMPVTITGTPVALTRDRCVNLTAPARAEQTRIQSVFPITAPSSLWSIAALPARDVAFSAPLLIALHKDPTAPADANVKVKFANPYAMPVAATMAVSGATTIAALTLSVGVGVSSSTAAAFEPDTSCGVSVTVDVPVAFYGKTTVGGTLIDADDKPVTVDLAKPVAVSWAAVTSGDADEFTITPHELTDNGAGGLTITAGKSISTAAPQAVLRGLQAGHTYALQIFAFKGHSAAAKGDFSTLSYPNGYTVSWSRSFKVN